MVRSSEKFTDQAVSELIQRYFGRSATSGSCLLISMNNGGDEKTLGLILTIDEPQNWGLGNYTTVSDILLSNDLFVQVSESSSEESRAFLLEIYLKFFEWLKEKKQVMVSWVVDDVCQEQQPLCQMLSKLLPNLCYIEDAYDSMTLGLM